MATQLTSSSGSYLFGSGCQTALVGMSINVLDHPELVESLRKGDMSPIVELAREQRRAGMNIIDVMLAHPDLDEEALMPSAVQMAAEASGLPISIDSTDPRVFERVLREYPHKALVNSVNGEEWKLDSILPIVRETGSAVVGLTMDDAGIPDDVEGRLRIAAKIIARAEALGIPREDVVIDVLCLSAGSSAPDTLQVTLEANRRVKQEFGTTTLLGIYNVGHGMPQKEVANLVSLVLGIGAGLDAGLVDPFSKELFLMVKMADFVTGRDPFAKEYLRHYRQAKQAAKLNLEMSQ